LHKSKGYHHKKEYLLKRQQTAEWYIKRAFSSNPQRVVFVGNALFYDPEKSRI